ncbi:MAG: methylated-DNA--[protein]-cysteine S-methyltransferase [Candidatus Promineifilaceae bacterium]|nr:methylated-DNA--[protein]-cysteine S-methyltransferase [Candidatus Promineifilaceae bacterium]
MMSSNNSIWMGRLTDSPLGDIWIAQSGDGLVAVDLWQDEARMVAQVQKLTGITPVFEPDRLAPVNDKLSEYFAGERKTFDEPIDWSVMTPFQLEVLRVVNDIDYGQTRTYGEIAKELNKPNAIRAVGRANATNPMPIIIPCHRVLGSDGRLVGYGAPGGVETKAWLLRLEGSRLI